MPFTAENANFKHVRVALCGCEGHVDRFGNFVNSYPESETVAVWDNDQEKAQKIADLLGGCRVETDYDKLLASDDIDGVVIVTANIYHADMILKAAKAGKNIFVEKPLCLDVNQAHAIEDAVQASGVKFFMSDPFVENTTIYLKDFIASGKLGKLLNVRIRFCSNMNEIRRIPASELRSKSEIMGGGMMSDTGGHPLHVLNYLLGKPEQVIANFAYANEDARESNYEQYITMLMKYPSDVTAFVEAGEISPNYIDEVAISGTKGVIVDHSVGDHLSEIYYKICSITPEELEGADPREIIKKDSWVKVSPEELPNKPDDHIRYWVKMQAYDIPNSMVGVDPASNHGVGITSSVELVEMRDAIYRSVSSGKFETV